LGPIVPETKRRRARPTGDCYYIPQDAAGLPARLRQRLVAGKKPVPAFPTALQVQTQSGCNAACAFCPNQKTLRTLSHGRMDEALFRKIVDECVAHRPRRISPFLMNEPLLDPGLPERIRYIAAKLGPGTATRINTNASRLEGEMARELLRCGLDSLVISFHGLSKEAYEASMAGLRFEENLERVNAFAALWREAPDPKPVVSITMLRTRLIEPEIPRIRAYWAERGLPTRIRGLGNRASVCVEGADLNLDGWEPYISCTRLVNQACILYNGDAVLCCTDWDRTTVLGNLRERPLAEVWNGETAVDTRRRYLAGDVDGILCGRCKRTGEV